LNFKNYLEKYGVKQAIKIEVSEENNVHNVGNFNKEHEIDCDIRDVETVDIFTDQSQWNELLATLKARKEAFSHRVDAKVLTEHKIWTKKQTREELLIREGLGRSHSMLMLCNPISLYVVF
jgi:hypothetical protein